MDIISVDKNNLKQIKDFLLSLSIIKDINDDVVLNGEYVFEEEVIGFLSFEEFNNVGLIRYFVFKKLVEQDVIKLLFEKICAKARRNIETLITLVIKDEAISVFKELGFITANKADVYIDEICINETRFRDAIVLRYNLTEQT